MNEDEKKDLQLPNLESVSDSSFSDTNEFAAQDLTELYKLIVSMKREQRERLFVDLGDSLGIETRRWVEYVNTDLAFFNDYAHIIIAIENSDLSSHQKSGLLLRIEAIAGQIVGSDKMADTQIEWIDLETNEIRNFDKANIAGEWQRFKEDLLKQLAENTLTNKMPEIKRFRAIRSNTNTSLWFDGEKTIFGTDIESLQLNEEEYKSIMAQANELGERIRKAQNIGKELTLDRTFELQLLKESGYTFENEENLNPCENCEGGCKCCE